MLEMFKGVANSPETTITNNISNLDTIIYVLDETRIPPELPNLMVLGTGTGAETVKVVSIDGNAITVERGFQGVAKAWNAGTIIARNFTEYDYNALVENVNEVNTNMGPIASLLSRIKTSIVNAINGLQEDVDAHKAENVSQTIMINRDVTLTGIQTITTTNKAKAITILANISGTKKSSFGLCVGTNQKATYSYPPDGNFSSGGIGIILANSSTDRTYGTIQNITATSFDINWTHSGTGATGTGELTLLIQYHGV